LKRYFQDYGERTNWFVGLISQKLCKDSLETQFFRLRTALKHSKQSRFLRNARIFSSEMSRSQFNSDKAWNGIFKTMENVKIVYEFKNLLKIVLKLDFPSWKQH